MLVDTKIPEYTEHILLELVGEEMINKLLVIDTHYHPDHVIGNKSWHEQGALIIASYPTSAYEDDWGYGSLTRERYIELIYRQQLSAKKY